MINFLKKTEELFQKKRHLTYQLPNRLKNLTFIPINNLFAGYIFYESWTDAVIPLIGNEILSVACRSSSGFDGFISKSTMD